ncbi:MAG: hypothetical protein GY698_06310 [Actinomycetia bacterium]|nr:hypothetical protein [Actinomycetes bacterium]
MSSSALRPARRLRRVGLIASSVVLAASSLTLAPSPADAVGDPITISGFDEAKTLHNPATSETPGTADSWHLYDEALDGFRDDVLDGSTSDWLVQEGIHEPAPGFLRSDVFFTGAFINAEDAATELADQAVLRDYLLSGRGLIVTAEADQPSNLADLDLTDAFDVDPTNLANVAFVEQRFAADEAIVTADVTGALGFTAGTDTVRMAGFKGYFDTANLPGTLNTDYYVLVETTFEEFPQVGQKAGDLPVVVVYPAGKWAGNASAGPLVLTADADIFADIDYSAAGGYTGGAVGSFNAPFLTELMNWIADELGGVVQQELETLNGYWMLDESGQVYPFGDAQDFGNAAIAWGDRAVDLEDTDDGLGYWVVDNQGNVFPKGSAESFSTPPTLQTGEEVTALSKTPSGNGYWLFTNLGRAFNYGDASHHGDMSAIVLNGPVLDAIPTTTGLGYYMVGSDGGVFAFGDAKFYGSMGGIPLNQPVQALVPDPDGVGYWLVAADGGVFAFQADFRGSMGDQVLNQPVTGMVPWGTGYMMVATDGGIFSFGGPFAGSLGGDPPDSPVKSVAAFTVG